MAKPVILLQNKFDLKSLSELKKNKIWKTVDIYKEQLKELYSILYPGEKLTGYKDFLKEKGDNNLSGAWVYYPWSGVLLHCVGPEDLYALRTNRNKNLITADEQSKLAESSVAIAGMSVGSGIALSCIYSGIGRKIKIADFDLLETANLNRLTEKLENIGTPKVELTARRIYELDPFNEVSEFGLLDQQNVNKFLNKPKVSAVVDEIDDFKMKVRLRLAAKEHNMPLIMFTSLGDNILVDIERYDLDARLEPFNGLLGDKYNEILSKSKINDDDIKKYAVQIVGQEHVPTRALLSLPEIGRTLVGRPQLYSTISVDGGLAGYIIRRLILNDEIQSGRYFIKFSKLFDIKDTDFDR